MGVRAYHHEYLGPDHESPSHGIGGYEGAFRRDCLLIFTVGTGLGPEGSRPTTDVRCS